MKVGSAGLTGYGMEEGQSIGLGVGPDELVKLFTCTSARRRGAALTLSQNAAGSPAATTSHW